MTKVVSLIDTLRWTDSDGVVQEEDDAKGRSFDLPKDEADRLTEGGSVAAPSSDEAKTATGAGFPGTHAELDDLAAANNVAWPEGTRTVADKQAALADAGIAAPGE